MVRSRLRRTLRSWLSRYPRLRILLAQAERRFDLAMHHAGSLTPLFIHPQARDLYIAVTARCNLRCLGCRYGRDFMVGQELSWPMIRDLLDDAKLLGFSSVRFYGGEPLLHSDLPRAIEYTVALGLSPWLTTNGMLLKEKIDTLYRAGLREIGIGFYGTDDEYNHYVQRDNSFRRLEANVAAVRERYGMDIQMELGWVLMRPNCNMRSLAKTWEFAERYSLPLGVNLIHYSLPYFTEGPNGMLQFRQKDRQSVDEVVAELIHLKRLRPTMIVQSFAALRSIPDWLLYGHDMLVPCDKYGMTWIGPDGTVQLCYVTFRLGNLHDKRLRDLLFCRAHRRAARDCFQLNCPHCHCGFGSRIEKHSRSYRIYSQSSAPQQVSG